MKRSKRRSKSEQESLDEGISALASKTFDGIQTDLTTGPQFGDLKPEQFFAHAARLLAMNHDEMSAEVEASPQMVMETGTTSVNVKKHYEALAEIYGALASRIACCVAKKLKQPEAA